MTRQGYGGPFTVGGDPLERKCPSVTVAVSLAISLAERAGGEHQRGVFKNGTRVARVTRHPDRSVTIETLEEES